MSNLNVLEKKVPWMYK